MEVKLMRYKVLVESDFSDIAPYYEDDCTVTVKDNQLVGPDPYPYPYCLVPDEDLTPDGCQCYKTADGIIFDDCGAAGYDFWYYIPETHIMFNLDILYNLQELGASKKINTLARLAHKRASKQIKRAVKQVYK
jgi:hypothetical protein